MSLQNINPLEKAEQWHFFTIAGVRSPGGAIVGEGKRKHEWDVKRGKGAQGATMTYVGIAPMDFSVTVQLWDAGDRGDVYYPDLDHFALWDAFLPLLKYDPTKKTPTAIDFYHPSFEGLGLRSVVCESVSNLQHKGKGLYEVKLDFLEYIPPPPSSAVATPSSSDSQTRNPGKTGPVGTVPDPAVVGAQAELDTALAKAKEKGWP